MSTAKVISRDVASASHSQAEGAGVTPSASLSFEERLQAAEAKLERILKILPTEMVAMMGDFTKPKHYDPVRYKESLRALKNGDRGKLLTAYIEDGGLIPLD